jgi:hypothetical protein
MAGVRGRPPGRAGFVTFLAPGYLIAAAVAAGIALGLHFLVTRHGPSAILPTARFIPAAPAAVVAVARRPSDLVVLLLRVAALGFAGLAFARPVVTSHRHGTTRIVLADRSSDAGDIGQVRDSVRQLMRDGDVLVVFDSAAHVMPPEGAKAVADSLGRASARGSLSAALIVARREAARLRTVGDSIEMDLISPVTGDELDAATPAIRMLWGGRIHVVRVAAAADSSPPPRVAIRAPAGDPLLDAVPVRQRMLSAAAAGESAGGSGATPGIRIVRDVPAAEDTAWVRAGQGHVLLEWPGVGDAGGWLPRRPTDTVGAVVAFSPDPIAVVASFARRWRLDGNAGRVRARWIDGEPAAVERTTGGGCIRDVAIPVAAEGDLVLRPEFADLVAALLRPCGDAWRSIAPVAQSDVAMIAGSGPLMATGSLAPASGDEPLVPWLAGAALALLIVEAVVRRDRQRPSAEPVPLAGAA